MKETKEFTAKEVEQMIKNGKVEYLNSEIGESVPDCFPILESPIVVGDLPEEKDEPLIIREVEFDESKK